MERLLEEQVWAEDWVEYLILLDGLIYTLVNPENAHACYSMISFEDSCEFVFTWIINDNQECNH